MDMPIVGLHNKAKVTGPGLVTGRSGSLGEVHFVSRDFWPLNTALWVKEFKRATLTSQAVKFKVSRATMIGIRDAVAAGR